MTIDEMVAAMEDLINSDEVVSIPGLDLKSVAENYVNVRYKPQLDEVKDEKLKEELRQKWITYYFEGDGKIILQMEIASIKANFAVAKESLTNIVTSVGQQLSMAAVPSVITVGSAPSTPNPAYTLLDNMQKKEVLKATLKQVSNSLVELLKSAIKIAFPIPDAVGAIIETLKTTKTVVNSIPG